MPDSTDSQDSQDKQLANTSGGLGELFSGSAKLPESVRVALSNAKAHATKRAYVSDWRIWFEWCHDAGKSPVPAEPVDIAEFLSLEAIDRKISTVIRRAAAIATLHRLAGFESPCKKALVKETLEGLRRMQADTPKHKSKAMVVEALKEVIANPNPLANPNEKKVLRDHALLLIGFAAAMRRQEIALIDFEHITWLKQGIEILIPHSKTDQVGEGIVKRVTYGIREETCPIRALEAWCQAADITTGWVFRPITRHGKIQERPLSDRSVAKIVKDYAIAAGVDGALEMAGSLAAFRCCDHGSHERCQFGANSATRWLEGFEDSSQVYSAERSLGQCPR